MSEKKEIMLPDKSILMKNLGKIAYTLDKAYLSRLKTDKYSVVPFANYYKDKNIDYPHNIRVLHVKRWVYDKEENIADNFKNVLALFANGKNNLALVINRTVTDTETYFVLKTDERGANEFIKSDIELLKSSLQGNFNGTEITEIIESEKEFDFIDNTESISVLCNIPSEKSEDYICQGIEKLLNGIVPDNDEENYTIIILAEPYSPEKIRNILSAYETMATAITPFASFQFRKGENETETDGEMDSDSEGISEVIKGTHSLNIAPSVNGVSLGGYGYTFEGGQTENKNKTKGKNHAVSIGSSKDSTFTYKSYMVSNLIEKLEKTMKRINESQATGLWRCATYVLAKNSKTSKNVANFLRSITQGDSSFLESSFVQEWSDDNSKDDERTKFAEIKDFLKYFTHPIFENIEDKIMVTPTANVSTAELANSISCPRYSVQNLPVINCARFGREPYSLNKLSLDLGLGCAYHMYQENVNKPIKLSKEKLKQHTFITGSTGSGKSNAIYTLISNLCPEKEHFLVIEPAKGEYKKIFGNKQNVSVYGTNPKISDMLKINPFSFPESIHVLEHLDRLIEIFNVCWPMYAAMPAILKDAMERAYNAAGWDLINSENPNGDNKFPNFADLLEQVEKVIAETKYSSDSKGDYSGALCTRIRSLTTGINRLIFSCKELSDEDLFDKNVIVDLSRVGSTETKSLIIGLLVMKLNEHRMALGEMNSELKHITVIEEAHNLLKRTSTEQSAESSNLLGKSVEMLANSIAEMRTYGEGFIIADQSPGLLDMSVIRNTNTKIILRLPELSDRELVGKAAGLNDEQIKELSKLELGVAAVYQNDWIEPVLVKVKEYNLGEGEGEYKKEVCYTPIDIAKLKKQLINFLIKRWVNRKLDFDPKEIKDNLGLLNLTSRLQRFVKERLAEHTEIGDLKTYKDDNFEELSQSICDILCVRDEVQSCVKSAAGDDAILDKMLTDIVRDQYDKKASPVVIKAINQCLMRDYSMGKDNRKNCEKIFIKWFTYKERRHEYGS